MLFCLFRLLLLLKRCPFQNEERTHSFVDCTKIQRKVTHPSLKTSYLYLRGYKLLITYRGEKGDHDDFFFPIPRSRSTLFQPIYLLLLCLLEYDLLPSTPIHHVHQIEEYNRGIVSMKDDEIQ